jgi:hypothetical protein
MTMFGFCCAGAGGDAANPRTASKNAPATAAFFRNSMTILSLSYLAVNYPSEFVASRIAEVQSPTMMCAALWCGKCQKLHVADDGAKMI